MEPDETKADNLPPSDANDASGRNTRAPSGPRFLNPLAEIAVHKHLLPHWQQDQVFYFVTWRLADSLPAGKLARWQREKEVWLHLHPKPWDAATEAEYHREFSIRLEDWLDAGHGSCLLRQTAFAQITADAFHHFNSQRYDLEAFVVMPNHVHILFRLYSGEALEKIIHSWKLFTAKAINRAAGRTGTLWQEGYWDTIIHNERHFHAVRRYIARNAKGGAGVPPTAFYQKPTSSADPPAPG